MYLGGVCLWGAHASLTSHQHLHLLLRYPFAALPKSFCCDLTLRQGAPFNTSRNHNMDIDDNDDDFYAPEEPAAPAAQPDGAATTASAAAEPQPKSDQDEDLEEGEEEDEGGAMDEDDSSDDVSEQ